PRVSPASNPYRHVGRWGQRPYPSTTIDAAPVLALSRSPGTLLVSALQSTYACSPDWLEPPARTWSVEGTDHPRATRETQGHLTRQRLGVQRKKPRSLSCENG